MPLILRVTTQHLPPRDRSRPLARVTPRSVALDRSMPTHESDTVEGKVFAPATGTSPFEDVLERRARSRAIANDDDDDDDDDESGVRWASDGLLVIDVQLDFMDPDGALAVKGGNEIVDVVCDLAEKFRVIVASQDYHPKVRERSGERGRARNDDDDDDDDGFVRFVKR